MGCEHVMGKSSCISWVGLIESQGSPLVQRWSVTVRKVWRQRGQLALPLSSKEAVNGEMRPASEWGQARQCTVFQNLRRETAPAVQTQSDP